MTFDLQEELKLRAFSNAAQIALEYLRAGPEQSVTHTIKTFNRIFKEVFQSTLNIVSAK